MKGKSYFSTLVFVAVMLTSIVPSYAQDIITKKDGTDIQAKVLEVNENEVKYRRYDYLDGPIFTMLKSDILIVRYENGTNDVFNGKGKSVPAVKSESQPTVKDTEDRDRDDVKKDKKDSKKDSKKKSSKKESKKDVKKEKKASEDEEEVVVEELEEVKKEVKKEDKKDSKKETKKDSKKESSKKKSKKDVKKEKKASEDEEEIVVEEQEEVKKDVKKEEKKEKEKKEKKEKKDSKKEKESSKKDKAVDGIEILSGDTYVLTQSAEAEVVFDYDNTVVEGKPLMEYLKGQGSDWVEEWPENQEFISGKFVDYFNGKSNGMTFVENEKAPYQLVIHVDKMDFGSVAGNPFNPYSGGAEVSGTVEVVDASNGKTRLSMAFTDIQGVRQMSATWRLEFAFIELAKRLLKFAK